MDDGEIVPVRAEPHRQRTAHVPVGLRPGATEPPVVTRTLVMANETGWGRRQMAPMLGRIRTAIARDGLAVLHVTSAVRGEGVSTIARELVKAAATLPSCRPLLLDCNPGDGDQAEALGGALPAAVDSYMTSGRAEVAAVVAGDVTFHAALFDAAASEGIVFLPGGVEQAPDPSRTMGGLYQSLLAGFNLIVADCPPVREVPYFVPIAPGTPEVVLVVRAERTLIRAVLRAKDAIPELGGRLLGITMNERRSYLPAFLRRRL